MSGPEPEFNALPFRLRNSAIGLVRAMRAVGIEAADRKAVFDELVRVFCPDCGGPQPISDSRGCQCRNGT